MSSNEKITMAAEELGKSLVKILLSPKYDEFDIPESVGIINLACWKAVNLLLEEDAKRV